MNINADGLADHLDAQARAATEDLAHEWFSRASQLLLRRGEQADYDVHPVVQSGIQPRWDETKGAWVISFPHVAAAFFEFGTEPHEIRATEAEMLAFEWPDAPPDVRAMFEETFPTVFFKSVDHPGTDELRFLRDSREHLRTR